MFTRIVSIKDSSQIKSLAYDVQKNKLMVVFDNGARYVYLDVSENEFGKLVSAKSVGKEFTCGIKLTHRFIRFTEKE